MSIRFSAIHRLDREPYHCFEEVHNHSSKESLDLDGMNGQGETYVACLRKVPTSYFKDFALEEGSTSRPACPFSNVTGNLDFFLHLDSSLVVFSKLISG
ncbi:hypothetical protein TorRG33x02_207430 [Trema orientale]|uniref:Uncharacterized protein n=1 Tax=Trema orientale TaxID=63057 RepID=A0A2P5ED45_TREOI|nr:hypothetical protein TorRG33x02_207430 [Trema orientale]